MSAFAINASCWNEAYCLSPNTILSEDNADDRIIHHIVGLLKKHNKSYSGNLSDYKSSHYSEIAKILKRSSWNFEADNFYEYSWYAGRNLLLGVNSKKNTIKIVPIVLDKGKDYGLKGIHTVSDISSNDKYLNTFVEEMNKEKMIEDVLLKIKNDSQTEEEFRERRNGFLYAVSEDYKTVYELRKLSTEASSKDMYDIEISSSDLDENVSVHKELSKMLGLSLSDVDTGKYEDTLIDILLGKNTDSLKKLAARALGDLATDKAIDALIKAYDPENFETRVSIINAMGDTKSPRVLSTLATVFNLDSEFLDAYAINALGQIHTKESLDILIGLLKGPYEMSVLTENIIESIGYIGLDEGVEPLIPYLGEVMFVNHVLDSFIQIGSNKVIDVLKHEFKGSLSKQQKLLRGFIEIGNDYAADALVDLLTIVSKDSYRLLTTGIIAIGGDSAVAKMIDLYNNNYGDKNFKVMLMQTIFILESSAYDLLDRKIKVDWKYYGVSAKTLRKSYMFAENREEYKKNIGTLFGEEAVLSLEVPYYSMRTFDEEETYYPLQTDELDLIEEAIDAVYGYLRTIKFDTDVKLGEEHEIIDGDSVPAEYFYLYPRGLDKNEIFTYPSNPLYQKIFSEHIPIDKVGVHRTVEQKVDVMDAKLIVLMAQLYSLGMIKENILVGNQINPKDSALWTIRYNDNVRNKYGEKVRLLQSTDWKPHMSGTLLWYFMNYADSFPLKWVGLRDLLLSKLESYNVNIYDYDEEGKEVTTSIQKKDSEGNVYEMVKYQYDLTKIPAGEKNSVMRLIINDSEVVSAITDMVVDVTENIMLASGEQKKMMAFEVLKEVHQVVARGEIPDQFARYREQSAVYSALDAVKDLFTDYVEIKKDSPADINKHVEASA